MADDGLKNEHDRDKIRRSQQAEKLSLRKAKSSDKMDCLSQETNSLGKLKKVNKNDKVDESKGKKKKNRGSMSSKVSLKSLIIHV